MQPANIHTYQDNHRGGYCQSVAIFFTFLTNNNMEPKHFKEANVVFAKDQPEYLPLPAFHNKSLQGEVITCWGLSFRERLRVLFTGEIWLCMLTFNNPLTPSFLCANKNEILTESNDL